MTLETLPQTFTVCQPTNASAVDLTQPFCFIARTDEELSLVCPTGAVPADIIAREDGWRGVRICGVLDFSLVGILAQIAGILAAEQISIFAVSTYNTDYVFIKDAQFGPALEALEKEGYTVIR